MMSIKCENCGQSISGRPDNCPNCNQKIIYKCNCGKELVNAAEIKCSQCREKDFRRKKIIIGILLAPLMLLFAILFVIDLLVPDPIPVVDELLLLIGTILPGAGFVWNLFRKPR